MNDDTKLVPSSQQPDYSQLIEDVRAIIAASQQRILTTVNTELVDTYWRIGKRIVEEEQQGKARAGYGEQVLARLGASLSDEYGRGWGERNLRYMRQFYLTYANWNPLGSELTWSHYRVLMRLPDDTQREFYTRLAASGRWSKRELEKQIKSQLHLRVIGSPAPEQMLQTAMTSQNAPPTSIVEAFKDPYVLDFLGLEDTYSEKNLEAALVRNIEKFLLELGNGFCFMGRQERLTIGGEDYYVDLIFYHRYLRCLVLIDLKIGGFEPADAAQMQLYLEWTKRHNKAAGEEDPIGLILCGSRDEQVVELLLSSQNHRMKVSQYLAIKDVEAIKAYLAKMSKVVDQLKDRNQ